MKNKLTNERTFKLTVIALSSVLWAGCAVDSPQMQSSQPSVRSASKNTTLAHERAVASGNQDPDQLKLNPSNSPQFRPIGPFNTTADLDILEGD